MSRRNAINSLSRLARSHPPSPTRPTKLAATMSSSSSSQPPRPPISGDGDAYNLARFVTAQDARQAYAAALAEVRAGRKESHWMWFVFPQLAGLARQPSAAARRYAVSSAAEARAYLAHPVLGARLREVSRAVLLLRQEDARDAADVMGGEVDEAKLRSCMTLFKRVVDGLGEGGRRRGDEVFGAVLERFFAGEEDAMTVEKLEEEEERRRRYGGLRDMAFAERKRIQSDLGSRGLPATVMSVVGL